VMALTIFAATLTCRHLRLACEAPEPPGGVASAAPSPAALGCDGVGER
jgi:hypothetical protein